MAAIDAAVVFDGLPTARPDVVLVEPADPESVAAALRLQRDHTGVAARKK